MKTITVKKFLSPSMATDIDKVSAVLNDDYSGGLIDNANWPSFRYRPQARFIIAWEERVIYIKYIVRESDVKAEMTEPNQPVYEDSCVEFFFMPGSDGIYYNFEFNSIGTTLLSAGEERKNRIFADRETIARIKTSCSLGNKPFAEKLTDISWDIAIAIPVEALFMHNIESLSGLSGRGNFYKCGDGLTHPHYLSWSPVESDKPDFHLPATFGTIRFD